MRAAAPPVNVASRGLAVRAVPLVFSQSKSGPRAWQTSSNSLARLGDAGGGRASGWRAVLSGYAGATRAWWSRASVAKLGEPSAPRGILYFAAGGGDDLGGRLLGPPRSFPRKEKTRNGAGCGRIPGSAAMSATVVRRCAGAFAPRCHAAAKSASVRVSGGDDEFEPSPKWRGRNRRRDRCI